MFKEPVNLSYDLSTATWEIIIMLLGAFILGYLLKKVLCGSKKIEVAEDRGAYAKYSEDDLKIVEGIGPKIEELLKDNGVKTWKDLAESKADDLKAILKSGGDRFQMHDPSSWADQAALAHTGKWTDLENYQDLLIGGRG